MNLVTLHHVGVITGDITQIDLPSDKVSGLKDAVRILCFRLQPWCRF